MAIVILLRYTHMGSRHTYIYSGVHSHHPLNNGKAGNGAPASSSSPWAGAAIAIAQ